LSRFSTIATALLLAAPPGLLAQDASSVAAAVKSITPHDVQARINLLADDSMRGRYTPSPELEEAANYIAGQFRSFGLKPGGDAGGYLQRYSVDQVVADTAKASVAIEGGATWRLGYEVTYRSGSGLPTGPVTGPVVVVSGTPPASPADLGIKGAIVIAVPAFPVGGMMRQANAALMPLLQGGAAAVILAVSVPDSTWTVMARFQSRPTSEFSWEPSALPPVLTVRDKAIAPVLAQQGLDLAALRAGAEQPFKVHPLPTLHLTLNLARTATQSVSAPNVVGILEGSDPQLRNEYLVFSGHMDHVGVGRPDARGDSIYNGADDDASGTTAVIELAEAFSKLSPRPKRSLIFLTVSGEERGLWGSSYFTARPPVPMSQIVADLNSDMVGRNWKDTIVVIGRQHSDLGQTLTRVNAAHPELDMTAIDDLWPEERFYFRSDHYNFARRGVPILFFFNGTHPDYHRPSDEPSRINAEKESRIVKLVFYLGLDVANNPERPKWNPESYREIVQVR
jgi:hypothetical protein